MTQAIYSVNNEGSIKNIGRDFRSYDYETVEKCAGLFLGDDSRKYVLRTRKLGGSRGDYEWNQNSVILYAACTPNAHEAILRLMKIGDVNRLDGYCFVVTDIADRRKLCGVFDTREALEAYLVAVDEDLADDLFVRIVPLNQVL